MVHEATLSILVSDAASRDALLAAADRVGLCAVTHASLDAFLQAADDRPGCVAADLAQANGAAVQLPSELRRRGMTAPVVFLAEKPPTALVVRALKAGAVTVVDMPCRDGDLDEALREAAALDAHERSQRRRRRELKERLARLTDKEREVLRMIMAGKANKTIASLLGASLRTVENRRRSIFAKIGVRSVAELVAAVIEAEQDSPQRDALK